jgi:hypothetical protein
MSVISTANIDLGHDYVYRSTHPDYGIALELQIRVTARNSRALLCQVLQRRSFRVGEQPPDWEPPTTPTLLRLPLQHAVDVVSVTAL